MSIVIALLISHFFLSTPWSYIVVIGAVFLEGFELLLWLRLRNMRSITGAEALIGAPGKAVNDCRPEGQVMVRGQLWSARCVDGVDEGTPIKVVGIEGGNRVLVVGS